MLTGLYRMIVSVESRYCKEESQTVARDTERKMDCSEYCYSENRACAAANKQVAEAV